MSAARFTPRAFKRQAHEALLDVPLQQALHHAGRGFVDRRAQAIAELDDFEALRARGRAIKDRALAGLADHLEQFEQNATAQGVQVHWAHDAAEANRIVVGVCQQADARHIAKSKSMLGEEIGLNTALEGANLEVVETDLGEYIIQLAKEPPSHIIAPAIHKNRYQIAELFRKHHAHSRLGTADIRISDIVDEARAVLRTRFLEADVGITGANFLVAESGSVIVITNEGNADLSAVLPPVHIVMAGIEKIVPTLDDAAVLLRLLGRSATGQRITAYTSLYSGSGQRADGSARTLHVVLVDNGRSALWQSELHDMLRCIRCGACLNHCPVYSAVGGHAYGWVYPGPMGSVLTPWFTSLAETLDLPNASSLCGRCEEVCPMGIPLPMLLRRLRVRQFKRRLGDRYARWALRAWAWVAQRPRLYRRITALAARVLALMARRGRIRRLPLAGAWTRRRDLPAPAGRTFFAQYRETSRERESRL